MKAIWRARQSREGIPFQVPVGAEVVVLKYYPKRRVMVEYQGRKILTLQGCIRRIPDIAQSGKRRQVAI